MSNNFINPTEKKIILVNKKKSEICKNLPKEDLSQRRTIEAIRSRLFDSYNESFKKAKTLDQRMFYLRKIKEITIEIKQDLKEKLKKRREEKLNLLNKKKLLKKREKTSKILLELKTRRAIKIQRLFRKYRKMVSKGSMYFQSILIEIKQ